MAAKIATQEQLSLLSNAVKKFVNTLISQVTKNTTDAISKVEGKINKIEDKSTGTTYTLSMENGLMYLDDGKD